MPKEVTEGELRNNSRKIMRALDRGESFLVTRNGVPIGELRSLRGRQWVRADVVFAVFGESPPIDPERFRVDLERWVDEDVSVAG